MVVVAAAAILLTPGAVRLAQPAAVTLAQPAAVATCPSSTLLFVAHPDDDLLFQSPDIGHDIRSGACVRTVFASSGDAGAGSSYWRSREQGAKAAAAAMAKVANAWTDSNLGIPGHPVTLSTLRDRPAVTLVFMRLPDGNMDGSGFSAYGRVSLEKLWRGSITSMGTEDNSASYTRQSLIGALSTITAMSAPSVVRVQDYVGSFTDVDHSDHHAFAYFAAAAHRQVSGSHDFIGYQGYGTAARPANASGTVLTDKRNAFFAYARYDTAVCGTVKECNKSDYGKWLQRQYTVGHELSTGSFPTGPVANAGPATAVPAGAVVQLDGGASYSPAEANLQYAWTRQSGPAVTLSDPTAPTPTFGAPLTGGAVVLNLVVTDSNGTSAASSVTIDVAAGNSNVALSSTAQASSGNATTRQTASQAVDGCIDGWPGNQTCEWATVGEKAGAWLQLSWPQPVTVDHVTLWDRPNLDDQVVAASLSYSDGGSDVPVGAVPNDGGSGLTVSFPPRTVTSIKLTITGVSTATHNAGLAEMQVFTPAPQ